MTTRNDEERYEQEDRAKAGNGGWTAEAIRALGAITDLQTLAGIFGCSGWSSRKMARTGEWERQGIKIFRIGAHYRVGVQSILDVLGSSQLDQAYGNGTVTQVPGSAAVGGAGMPEFLTGAISASPETGP